MPEAVNEQRKRCRGCGKRRAIKFFNKDSKNRDGFRLDCKDCEKKRTGSAARVRRSKEQRIKTLKEKAGSSLTKMTPSEIETQAHRAALIVLMERHHNEYIELVRHHRRRLTLLSVPQAFEKVDQ